MFGRKSLNKGHLITALTSTREGRVLLIALLSLPIVGYYWPILASGISFSGGDFDMQLQMTEAAKVSLLQYHQFPLWNPWVSGGIPLFADPQFGLFSLPTFLSLFFPTPIAWKLTLVIYTIVGFFGMRKLLSYVSRPTDIWGHGIILLLGYIWAFNSFFYSRFNGGHFTFLLLQLLPLVTYLALSIMKSRWRILQLGVIIAYLLYSALHYPSVFTLLFVTLVVMLSNLCGLVTELRKKADFKYFTRTTAFQFLSRVALAYILAIFIAAPRIVLSLSYLHDNGPDRTISHESYIGLKAAISAFVLPPNAYTTPRATYGPFEMTNYLGPLTLLLLILLATYTIVSYMTRGHTLKKNPYLEIFSLVGLGALSIGVGGKLYSLVQHVPVLSSMRVSTRYFLLVALIILVVIWILVSSSRNRRLTYLSFGILTVSTVFLMVTNVRSQIPAWYNNHWLDATTYGRNTAYTSPPTATKYYHAPDAKKYGLFNLSGAMKENKQQLVTDSALLETRAIGTNRCDELNDEKCSYILTSNAVLVSWSPNEISLRRTGPGEIRLNINPGSGWFVNGTAIFSRLDTVTSVDYFVIPETTGDEITLRYRGL